MRQILSVPIIRAQLLEEWFIFTSGQIPFDPDTGKMVGGDFKTRVNQVFKNLSAILGSADSDLSINLKLEEDNHDGGDCGKVYSVYYRYGKVVNYQAVNDVFNEWLDEETAPARSLVSVRQLPANADIEIECIALC